MIADTLSIPTLRSASGGSAWYILSHHDGNSRLDALHVTDSPAEPDLVTLDRRFRNVGGWSAYCQGRHGLALVWASNHYAAVLAYRAANKRRRAA